eukprot:99566-Chlamydomonas_euryale.AAC.1
MSFADSADCGVSTGSAGNSPGNSAGNSAENSSATVGTAQPGGGGMPTGEVTLVLVLGGSAWRSDCGTGH